jgi:hypothetical protein
MSPKKIPKKSRARVRRVDWVTIRGPWPDPQSREEISHREAESDAGKHSKNPDWKKKWSSCVAARSPGDHH